MGAIGRELEGQAMPGVVGVQEIAGEREELSAVLCLPVSDAVVLVEPGSGLRVPEGGRRGRDADLASAKIPCQVNHCRQLGAGEYATRVEERLVRHQEPAGARLSVLDRGRQMRIDALAIAHELSEPLPHRLVHLHACLGDARVGGSNEEIGISQVPLYERKLAVAVKG